jgi:oligopeptide/dipeptide ABC transporter ATP-binding protein
LDVTTALLEIKNLTKVFSVGPGDELVAVRDVSFSLRRGETIGLVGESGSGKTTLGRCVLRLIEPTQGQILLGGKDIRELDGDELQALRARMQLVFQDPFASLNPRMTVRQAVSEPLALQGIVRAKQRERVAEIINDVGLDMGKLNYYPLDLTASEQQRVGIARALVTHPEFVVLDEPTSMLDPSARTELLNLLQKMQRELGTAYIFISHDLTSVARISHRIAIMYLGSIVEEAPTNIVMSRQRHPYSRALLSAVLFPDPRRPPDRYSIEGEIPTAINPRDECPLYGRCPIREDGCRNGVPPMRETEAEHFSACRRWEFVGSA